MKGKDVKDVVVIGAGLGALSTAIRLAAARFSVTVIEQSEQAGGKAGTLQLGPYRFDTGPSLITMAEVFDQLFHEAGEVREEQLPFTRLDTVCSYFFDDRSRFDAPGSPLELEKELSRVLGEKPGTGAAYLDYSRIIYEKSAPLFLYRSLHEPSSWIAPEVRHSLFKKGDLDVRRTMDEANRSLFQDPRTVQLFNRYATYNGSSPFQVPATLNIIPHVEYTLGAYGSPGGIIAIPEALYKLAKKLGVKFLFGEKAEEIITPGPGSPVEGVRTDKRTLPARIVVTNTDVRRTYEKLLKDPEAPLARRYRKLEPSSSGLVFFWGMKKGFPSLGLNNIFFSADYRAEFKALFDHLTLPEDPTIYVNISSKLSPVDAPEDGENWFILINAPRDNGQDWSALTTRARAAILRRLERILGEDVASAIREEASLNPRQIAETTGSSFGSLYGISSNSKTAAFLRHRNRSRRYPGLYFVGGSVHPGGGMPLAILSGKIAADLIKRRQGLGKR